MDDRTAKVIRDVAPVLRTDEDDVRVEARREAALAGGAAEDVRSVDGARG